MASVGSEASSSLLIPPNPSLSATKPSASILLNGTGRPHAPEIPSSSPPLRSTTPIPPSPSLSAIPSSPSSSLFSPSLSSLGSPPPTRIAPLRRGSSPKISFAPLPSIPPELKRRNSISIGVASRKNLLGAGSGASRDATVHKVHMTDQEWEDYKRQFEAKNGGGDVIDLGAVAKQGAKALWGKMKRGRSSSTSSTSSLASTTSASTSASDLASQSAPIPAAGSASTSTFSPGINRNTLELGTVEEEEPVDLSPSPVRRSVSSPPHTGRAAGLGSPPPRRKSLGRANSDPEASPATTISTIYDENETETESESDAEGEMLAEVEAAADPHDAGFRAANASLLQKNKILEHLEESNEEGEATPRRMPSPPPRKARLPRTTESASKGDDDDDENDEEEGRRTPAAPRGTEWAMRDKHDRSEVLGFDPERFGMALDIAVKNGSTRRAHEG